MLMMQSLIENNENEKYANNSIEKHKADAIIP
jgi:hypothetical protein